MCGGVHRATGCATGKRCNYAFDNGQTARNRLPSDSIFIFCTLYTLKKRATHSRFICTLSSKLHVTPVRELLFAERFALLFLKAFVARNLHCNAPTTATAHSVSGVTVYTSSYFSPVSILAPSHCERFTSRSAPNPILLTPSGCTRVFPLTPRDMWSTGESDAASLSSLRRLDAGVVSIIGSASQGAVFSYDEATKKWVRGVGGCGVARRSAGRLRDRSWMGEPPLLTSPPPPSPPPGSRKKTLRGRCLW